MFLVIGADVISKNWADQLEEIKTIGFIKFKLIHNHGIILGTFSDLPLNVKEVGLLTLGSIILASYFIGLWLIPIKSRVIYIGLSLLVGGIMGNVIDRINDFSVIDFITINAEGTYPYLNIADLSQIFAYVILFYGLHKDSQYYWPTNDWRLKFLINPKFQLRASCLNASITFFSGLIILTFSFSFFKSFIPDNLHVPYFVLGLFVSMILSSLSFLMSIIVTHRVAGPIYAIKRHILQTMAGENIKFKLRENDEFKDIEETLNNLSEKMNSEAIADSKSKKDPA